MVIHSVPNQSCLPMVMATFTTNTKQLQPLTTISLPAGAGHLSMESFRLQSAWKEKVVLVMGATGTGKSRLSVDLATHFPAEVINSDKMQVYKGLDVVTNKITDDERRGVVHHLLGVVDPEADFPAVEFRRQASHIIEQVHGRGRVPIIAGGSNSYIKDLVDGDNKKFRSRYHCCFLWVDVALPVLHSFVSERVDKMVEAGLVQEARGMFSPDGDYSRGIRRAIGVPEMDSYFRAEESADAATREKLLQSAIDDIKANTCTLACRQLQKINRLARSGWDVYRHDATEVFLRRGREADEAWERLVARPSVNIVRSFLYGSDDGNRGVATSGRRYIAVDARAWGGSGGATAGANFSAKATAATSGAPMATAVAFAGVTC